MSSDLFPIQDSIFPDHPFSPFTDCTLDFDTLKEITDNFHPIQDSSIGDFPVKKDESEYNQCFMQRSFSSISFDRKPGNSLNHVNPPALTSPAQMIRRVCSTGDLLDQGLSNFRGGPGRYTAEERKERIHRYREKRTQRNFTKTIKYACRKTLADNRPRVRGRFARNDEPTSSDQLIPKTASYDEEEDIWNDNLKDNEGTVRGGNAFRLWDPTTGGQYCQK